MMLLVQNRERNRGEEVNIVLIQEMLMVPGLYKCLEMMPTNKLLSWVGTAVSDTPALINHLIVVDFFCPAGCKPLNDT